MFEKVYIIDDDEVSVFLAQTMLEAEGFAREYETFQNPCDAIHQLLPILQQEQTESIPNAIFLDLNMPQMDGWHFLDKLSPHAELLKQNCRLYILTSSLDSMDVRKAKTYDFLARFLQKPLEESDIQQILHGLNS
ncbi:response regulator [Pontibacter chinhatensis]|uniref:CheY chemotaxis protein or a CheY-like REC (Receiver) domain n=1 Tax=Pontibacter chinhatensis TaxID=1436961 RepID=A0A1I2NU33_9BACT|nr:response regulator [Pontibacter chinhatensis]SFG05117.1 CheY chemotaxis protein or a CheY-like REC (receiver) domain [Pontibacter chinhatensis]